MNFRPLLCCLFFSLSAGACSPPNARHPISDAGLSPIESETSLLAERRAESAVIERAETKQPLKLCPSLDFSVFIENFLADERLQEAFTRFPYETVQYDPQDLDRAPRVLLLQKAEVNFPLILNRRLLGEKGVEIEISKKSSNRYEVFTHSQGSGAYSRAYLFQKYAACWFLISMTDGST